MKSMNEQMELFELGGLKSNDNLKNDPVSGNPIPPGSNAKEVRDDLPAMLSEGEYVVPADVVKFFGVDRFERMRNEAKQGLAKMDKDGRIGGEPINTPLPQSVPQAPMQMNPGGLTRNDVTRRNFYTGEFSFERPGAGRYDYQPGQPIEPVEGESDPDLPSPENCARQGKIYDPVAKVCVDPVQRDDNSPPPETPVADPWYQRTDWGNPQAQLDGMFNSKLPGLLGGVLGAITGPGNLAHARSMANIYTMMGQDENAKIVNDFIDEEIAESRVLGYADKVLDDIFGTDGDMMTIAAMREAGIDVDKSLRDRDFREYMRNLNQFDRDKLIRYYGEGKYQPDFIRNMPGEKKPKDYTKSEMRNRRAEFQERQQANLEAEQQAQQSQQRQDEDSRANDSFHEQMVQQHVERMQAQRDPMGQRTTTATYNTPSTGRFEVSADDDGLNKGGLMVKKKGKKKK